MKTAGRSSAFPAELALGFRDPLVIDAGKAAGHVAVLVELPVLIAMTAPPLACLIMPFVFEADRNAIAGEGPECLLEPVIGFLRPFAF